MSARLAVLVSGRGSNLDAILDACERGALAARVVAVISDSASAAALVRAWARGVSTEVVDARALP